MTRFLRIHSLASLELTEAIRWYESKRVGLGQELLDEFAALIARLTMNPESGNPISIDQDTRRLLATTCGIVFGFLLTSHVRRNDPG